MITHEHVDRTRGKTANVLAEHLVVAIEEVVREEHDIALTLAQRRNVNRENVQAVVKVFSELSFTDHLLQILVRSRNDADIHTDCFISSDTLEFMFLKHAEKLDLERCGDFPDFIEEDSAAVCHFEAALVFSDCTGERSLFMTEEFTFDDVFWESGTVHADKRTIGAVGVVVDCLSDEFLTGTRFAEDQNR